MTDLSGSWRTGADLTDHPWAGATVAEATLQDCDLMAAHPGIRITEGEQ